MPERLDELTSIRAFAAGAICVQHVFVFVHDVGLRAAPDGFGLSILYNLALGVDLFFILSGFILTHVYARQFRTESFQYGQFMANRLARIYPLHVFVIALLHHRFRNGRRLRLLEVGRNPRTTMTCSAPTCCSFTPGVSPTTPLGTVRPGRSVRNSSPICCSLCC